MHADMLVGRHTHTHLHTHTYTHMDIHTKGGRIRGSWIRQSLWFKPLFEFRKDKNILVWDFSCFVIKWKNRAIIHIRWRGYGIPTQPRPWKLLHQLFGLDIKTHDTYQWTFIYAAIKWQTLIHIDKQCIISIVQSYGMVSTQRNIIC